MSEKLIREKNPDNTNQKVHIGKIQTGKYQLETTNRKIQIGKIQFGKYNPENLIWKIHSGRHNSGNTYREYKSENTSRTLQIAK